MGNLFFDQYSILHLASGIIAYFFGINFWLWFLLHLLFEIVENTPAGITIINTWFASVWPGGKPAADHPINSIGDQTFAMLGWLIAYFFDYLGKKYHLYEPHLL